jgi:PAS domain S-box-containing protein
MKILYVEDDSQDAALVAHELATYGPELTLEIAESLRAAFARLEPDAPYDVVLTDVHLEDGNGLTLLTHIRARGWPVAVVLVTGGGDEDTVVAALKAGANDYVLKRPTYNGQLAQALRDAHGRFMAEVARRSRPLRVLYADDSVDDTRLVARHMAHHAPHVQIEVVHTASDALRRLPLRGPVDDVDVFLLGFRLPDRNALAVLHELSQVRALDLPTVVVTGQGDEESALQVLRLGGVEYVVKTPGYLVKLPSVLENAFHRAELLRSEAQYRSLVEQIPAVSYSMALDAAGTFLFVSPQVEAILGESAASFRARPGCQQRTCIHADDWERVNAARLASRAQSSPFDLEYRWRRPDGREVWLRDQAAVVRGPAGEPRYLQGILLDLSERRRAEAERERLHAQVREAHRGLQEMSLRLLEVQEAERRHLARELHDEIGQQLTGLKLLIDMNAQQPGKPVRASLSQAQVILQDLLSAVRELSLSLRPAMLDDLGLLPALLWHLERFGTQTGIRVAFQHSGIEAQRFGGAVETAAYRIVQEALTNVARYAGVRAAEVRLWAEAGRLHLEVIDHGPGFDPHAALRAHRSSGLAGMAERAQLLGGQFRIESQPGFGTRLTASLPVEAPATPAA